MLSQSMADPQMGDEVPLKGVIRHLESFPECISNLYFQDAKPPLVIMSDSDWAGDDETRKSTSGGLVRYGGHLISHWCKTQATVALSSGEAELNAIVKGCSEGIGVYELLRDLGCNPKIFSSETDSSAARGTVLRTGVGKMKHLSTKQLWVQGAIKIYEIDVVKIPRGINSADLLTHGCTTADFNDHLERLFPKRPRPSYPLYNLQALEASVVRIKKKVDESEPLEEDETTENFVIGIRKKVDEAEPLEEAETAENACFYRLKKAKQRQDKFPRPVAGGIPARVPAESEAVQGSLSALRDGQIPSTGRRKHTHQGPCRR